MGRAFLIILILPSVLSAQTNADRVRNLKEINRLAFGSCNNQNHEQPLWRDLLRLKPDIWVWGGDNIYADWGKSDSVRRAYEKQNAQPDYARFKSLTPMVGTWDDHDYGLNGAGGDLNFKKESQRLHLDFFDVEDDSPRRSHEGIYTSYDFGIDHKIKIIILDNRYFKGLDQKTPLLGGAQWLWLEEELKNSHADLHFFVTGLSVFSPTLPYSEEWWHFPVEVNRMLGLLNAYKVKAPIFLTGDKHFSTIFKYWRQLEFLSSGMTHSVPRSLSWYLRRKYPRTYFGTSYGVIDINWNGTNPELTLFIRNGSRDIHKTKVVWEKEDWKFKPLGNFEDPQVLENKEAFGDEPKASDRNKFLDHFN